ncbi:hypothetical protein HHK36_018886 [Tetracentron sinense]|uniref:RRM domain-containing protein n=1 Tax=Tetracentron sinense TaxID=13715 RepID=A0A834YV77_TETSI|nr:hypothetical protein HHK36_018886 [Tetracentron sinense]
MLVSCDSGFWGSINFTNFVVFYCSRCRIPENLGVYSCSLSPHGRYERSVSRSLSRSPSRSCDSSEVENPGNNLYVTGLSARTTKKELEKHFSSEGGTCFMLYEESTSGLWLTVRYLALLLYVANSCEGILVEDIHLVVDPWTRESRGFGFVTMSTVKEADHCLRYLNHSVLEGRVITVEKARRRRGRTPTSGRYHGLRTIHVRRQSPSYSPYYRSRHSSPCYSSEWDRERSYSPCNSPRKPPLRYHSPYSRSPVGRRDRSYYPYHSRCYSPRDRSTSPYYRSHRRHTSGSISSRARGFRRSYSRSGSPWARRSLRRSYSHSLSPRPRGSSRRSYSHSVSPRPRRRSSRRSYSRSVSSRLRRSSRRGYSRSVSPRPKRSLKRNHSRSVSPRPRRSSRRSYSRNVSPRLRRSSRRSYSCSISVSPRLRSYSRESSRSCSLSSPSASPQPSS